MRGISVALSIGQQAWRSRLLNAPRVLVTVTFGRGRRAAAFFTKTASPPLHAVFLCQLSLRHFYPRAAIYPVQDQLQSTNPVRTLPEWP